jgi:hypothetical protein
VPVKIWQPWIPRHPFEVVFPFLSSIIVSRKNPILKRFISAKTKDIERRVAKSTEIA